jgi:hypothetical protein
VKWIHALLHALLRGRWNEVQARSVLAPALGPARLAGPTTPTRCLAVLTVAPGEVRHANVRDALAWKGGGSQGSALMASSSKAAKKRVIADC